MGKIDELIKQLCPDGVKFVKLGDFFDMFKGMSKVSKKWADTGNCKFIDYLNIYNNMTVDVAKLQNATVATFKQNNLKEGDILFTCASETPYECAISAVIREPIAENTFLDDHLNGIRVKREFKEMVLPAFINYYFYSVAFRKSICKIVRGVTRFYIVNKSFLNIMIPLPPLAVQEKIVEVLDTFTGMIDNLQKELEQRQKQFEHYRDQMLTFKEGEVQMKPIKEIGKLVRGNGLQKKDFTEDGTGCIHYGQIYTRFGLSTSSTLTFVDSQLAAKLTKVSPGDLVIACTSENIEDVCKSVAWLGKEDIVTGGHACVFKHSENPKYIAYCFTTSAFFLQKRKYAYGAKVIDIKTEKLGEITLPVPSLEKQQEIVDKLDTFEALISNIKQEIELRQKQYEFYREKLLTFE